jgi:hypothetical protein
MHGFNRGKVMINTIVRSHNVTIIFDEKDDGSIAWRLIAAGISKVE